MEKKYTLIFWLLPTLLFTLQAVVTFNSMGQIRYEELANSIRNPFWLSERLVYDGASTSVGWDGTMLVIYNLFGFDLFAGKFFRLFLSFFSLLSLAFILKKYLGEKWGWMPLIVIGFSPTLLFYTSLQAQYGIDLQYLPIVAFLLISKLPLIRILGALLSMVVLLSYPPFMFYLPALIWVHIKNSKSIKERLLAILAFISPFVSAYLYINNKDIFLNDPNTGSGVLRGAGSGINFENIPMHLAALVKDFFDKGSSYHFEVFSSDFSMIFPMITFFFVIGLGFMIAVKSKGKERTVVLIGLFTLFFSLGIVSLTGGLPGMRRYTPILGAFYGLFALAWWYISKLKVKSEKSKVIGIGIMSLLLIHHLIIYPVNLIHLKDPSPERDPIWFSSQETPQKSLDQLVETVQKEDLKLACLDERGQPLYCRYAESYAAVAGECKWNKLDCHQIYGYDFNSRQFIPLDVKLWESYYFEH